MKSIYYSLLIAAISFTSCKKDPVPPAPAASFSIDQDQSSAVTIIATKNYPLSIESDKGTSFTWDFGNGVITTKKDTTLSINKAGNYTVSLTVKNSTGQTTVVKKQVKVVSPILKNITIKTMDWIRSGESTFPKSHKADIWIELTKREKGVKYPIFSNGVYDAPVMYKSPVFQNITPEHAPISFDIPEKLVLDEAAISAERLSVLLYAKDATGTYLLYSRSFSGSNEIYNGSVSRNAFLWSPSFMLCQMDMTGTYE